VIGPRRPPLGAPGSGWVQPSLARSFETGMKANNDPLKPLSPLAWDAI
jgi:hypothetical protein